MRSSSSRVNQRPKRREHGVSEVQAQVRAAKELEKGYVDVKDPLNLAQFLLRTRGLSRQQIGELLGDEKQLAVLDSYCRSVDFRGHGLLLALRLFLSNFQLPNLPQKIDRIVERFSWAYVHDNGGAAGANPHEGGVSGANPCASDETDELATLLLIINSTFHNKNISQHQKMSKEEFIKIFQSMKSTVPLSTFLDWYASLQSQSFQESYEESARVYARMARDPAIVRAMLQRPAVDAALLEKGALVIKFSRRGRAQQRCLRISPDMANVEWCRAVQQKGAMKITDSNAPRSYPLKHLVHVGVGAGSSPLFTKQGRLPEVWDPRCLALVFHIPENEEEAEAAKNEDELLFTYDGIVPPNYIERVLAVCVPEDHDSIRFTDWVLFFHQQVSGRRIVRRLRHIATSSKEEILLRLENLKKRCGAARSDIDEWEYFISRWEELWISVSSTGSASDVGRVEDEKKKKMSIKDIFRCQSSSNHNQNANASRKSVNDSQSTNKKTHNDHYFGLDSPAVIGWRGVLDRGDRFETTKSRDLVRLWTRGIPDGFRSRLWPIALGIETAPAHTRQLEGLVAIANSIRAAANTANDHLNQPSDNLLNNLDALDADITYLTQLVNSSPNAGNLVGRSLAPSHILSENSMLVNAVEEAIDFPEEEFEVRISGNFCSSSESTSESLTEETAVDRTFARLLQIKVGDSTAEGLLRAAHEDLFGALVQLRAEIEENTKKKNTDESHSQESEGILLQTNIESDDLQIPETASSKAPDNGARRASAVTPASRRVVTLHQNSDGQTVEEGAVVIVTAILTMRPDISYSRALLFISIILTAHSSDVASAFSLLVAFLGRPLLADAHSLVKSRLDLALRKSFFTQEFKEILPQLATHFEAIGMTPETFLLPWINSLFLTILPLPTALIVWDNIFLLGDSYVLQVTLGILKYLESSLLGNSFANCTDLLYRFHAEVLFDQFEFFKAIAECRVEPQAYSNYITKRKIAAVQRTSLMELVILNA